MSLMSYICNLLPIQAGKLVFYSFTESYADNPRAIAEELLRRGWNGELVWATKEARRPLRLPRGVRAAVGRCRMRYELSTAQAIVSNTRLPRYWMEGFRKKAGQLYIQTWHGSCGIKKMEADMPHARRSCLERAKADSRQVDYLLSNCRWLTHVLRRALFYDGEILEIGSPRNDALLRGTEERAKAVRAALGLPTERKLLLYAPTFRDGKGAAVPPMPNWRRLREALEARFGGEWSILVRLHPGLSGGRRKPTPGKEDTQVLDLSGHADMADLLVIADVLVTDYSSCAYDFLLTRRPGFLYAPDCADYEQRRGLYYPLAETPFPTAESSEQLEQSIRSFDEPAYRAAAEQFLRDKGSVDDGHAAEHVADILEKHRSGKEAAA